MKYILSAILLSASFAAPAFTLDMTPAQVQVEVSQLLSQKIAPDVIFSMVNDITMRNLVFDALVFAGVDPSAITVPTSSGTNTAMFSGYTGFSQTRASSVGGGSRTSVSPN